MDSDINSNSSSDEEDFNEDWIEKINTENKIYNDFFITENKLVNVKIYYINRKNELFNKKIIKQNISNGLLKKETLLHIIKKHMYLDKKIYRLLSILSYNFDLDNFDIKKYYKNQKDYIFLNKHKEIKSIKWEKTINYFKELNELYIFFVEKKTKKNNTKKIIIHNKLNKTKRKRLK
tara:strand:- start:93 stop:623 length:531 start_codon:yes stop_codon:yes gene_type:complete